MSYDPAGIYNLPPVYKAEPGTTIRSEQHNSPLEDIAQALSFVLVRDGRNGMIGTLRMGGYPISNVAPGTAATDAATVGQTVPIGTILDYALPTPPAGWIFCYGQALTSGQYPLLRQALLDAGSPYGTDGSGNPRVPDFRGRTGIGRDNMGGTAANRITNSGSGINGGTLGASGGAETHKLVPDEMPEHDHTGTALSAGGHRHQVGASFIGSGASSNGGYITNSQSGVQTSLDGEHEHALSINASGGDKAHNNVQPSLVVNKIIRAAY